MKIRYIHVKEYKNSVKKTCLQCGRSATVTATRVKKYDAIPLANRAAATFRQLIQYCAEHAISMGVTTDEVDEDLLADTARELAAFGPALEATH